MRIDFESEEHLFRDCVRKWGVGLQLTIAMEECAELQIAISKYLRYGDSDRESVIEECADVVIAVAQTLEIVGGHLGEFYDVIDRKINRMAERCYK